MHSGRLQNDKEKGFPGVPQESLSQANTDYTDCFLDQIGRHGYTKLQFFEECDVIVTSGNRVYGNFYIGEPAIEIQRYASNANYTLNLLHSVNGVDYFDVLIKRQPSISNAAYCSIA